MKKIIKTYAIRTVKFKSEYLWLMIISYKLQFFNVGEDADMDRDRRPT